MEGQSSDIGLVNGFVGSDSLVKSIWSIVSIPMQQLSHIQNCNSCGMCRNKRRELSNMHAQDDTHSLSRLCVIGQRIGTSAFILGHSSYSTDVILHVTVDMNESIII